MPFVHRLHAALRFPGTRRLLHFDGASRRPAPSDDGREETDISPILQPGLRDAQISQFKETAMFTLKTRFAAAAIAVAAAGSFATPAIAGQCPTPGMNALADAPMMP